MNKNPKILIIGATGELGTKLLKYCNNKKISITSGGQIENKGSIS